MGRWKSQFVTIPGQSSLHEMVREIFCTDPFFKYLNCWQEVYVKDLIPDYLNSKHRYDFYIENLNIILELQGIQHYRPQGFSNISYDQKIINFELIQKTDKQKRIAAINNDFIYKEISYKDQNLLTAPFLKTKLFG